MAKVARGWDLTRNTGGCGERGYARASALTATIYFFPTETNQQSWVWYSGTIPHGYGTLVPYPKGPLMAMVFVGRLRFRFRFRFRPRPPACALLLCALLLVCLRACVPVVGASAQSSGSKEAVKSAKAFLDKKEYDRARFACENALVLDPSNANLLLLHGKACTGLALVRVKLPFFRLLPLARVASPRGVQK